MQELELTGNEAIAWAAKCMGVDVATGYPGLPCTSIINTLKNIAEPSEMRVEWSGNERIALETAFGVSISGGRSLSVQKMAGLNVALDSLMVMNILGTLGGMVVAVGDVPGSIFSGNEQDSRNLGAFAELPVLEPGTPQEAFDFTVEAYQISEKFGVPVVLRFAKGFALAKGMVSFDCDTPQKMPITSVIKRSYAPAAARVGGHKKLHQKMKEIQAYFADSQLNTSEGSGDKAVVTSGFTYVKVKKVMEAKGLLGACKLIKVGTLNPLPQEFLSEQLAGVTQAMAIEEIEPFLEDMLRVFANTVGQDLKVFGKTGGQVQWEGELSPEHIELSLDWLAGDQATAGPDFSVIQVAEAGNELPGFCDDCPYEFYFSELKKYLAKNQLPRPVFTGEPGCSIYLEAPPFEMLDAKTSLGGSLGLACGLSLMQTDRETVAIVGDSAFFHSEIPTFVYAAQNGINVIAMIVYNHAASVTGRQPNPASGFDLKGEKADITEIAEVVSACKASLVKTVKGKDEKALWDAFDAAFNSKGLRVLILDDLCPMI
ncbi:MAG: hypothetical protein KQI62_08420 [Deltaproteobacteria bacterium]|nr:hypothetical protein [Deltaproteobacteria bacterium]